MVARPWSTSTPGDTINAPPWLDRGKPMELARLKGSWTAHMVHCTETSQWISSCQQSSVWQFRLTAVLSAQPAQPRKDAQWGTQDLPFQLWVSLWSLRSCLCLDWILKCWRWCFFSTRHLWKGLWNLQCNSYHGKTILKQWFTLQYVSKLISQQVFLLTVLGI